MEQERRKNKTPLIACLCAVLVIVLLLAAWMLYLKLWEEPTDPNKPCIHTFGDWGENTLSTCEMPGEEKRICTVCGESEERPIAALGHDEISYEAQAPTCTAIGWDAYVVCGREGCDYTTYAEQPSLGHSHDAVWSYDSDAHYHPCTREGCEDRGDEDFHVFDINNFCDVCKFQGETDASMFSLFFSSADGGYVIHGYHGNATKVFIPEQYNGIDIVAIHEYAFGNCDFLISVEISEKIEKIDRYAFDNCDALISVTFKGDSRLRAIETGAFSECTNLTNFQIPSGVMSVGSVAFYACDNLIQTEHGISYVDKWVVDCDQDLSSVAFRTDTVGIATGAFYYCADLKNIDLPTTLISICSGAFSGRTGLVSLTIPASVKSIGAAAFACGDLKSITVDEQNTVYHSHGNCLIHTATKILILGCENSIIPADGSVTSIGASAFYGCKGLENIELPYGIVDIKSSAFAATGLTNITIPASVISIGDSAFSSCFALTDVVFSEDSCLIAIGEAAFQNCTSITQFHILAKIVSIEKYTFAGCTALSSVTFGGNSRLNTIRQYAFQDACNLRAFEFPTGVITVETYAFAGCTELIQKENGISYVGKWIIACDTAITHAVLRSETVGIAERAFYGCKKMESINLGDAIHLTSIGDVAFSGCGALTNLNLPDNVINIGVSAFSGCTSLKSIYIPSKVNEIGRHAFFGCTGLVNITLDEEIRLTRQVIGVFSKCDGVETITMPAGVVKKLFDHNSVPKSLKVVVIVGDDDIDDRSFMNFAGLTDIHISEGIKTIGAYAFSRCYGLTSIEIPASVKKIEDGAFEFCQGLTTISFAKSSQLETIGDDAFNECIALSSIEIPAFVKSIGSNAFCRCRNLKNVYFPDDSQLTVIGSWAFYKCNLVSIQIPSSVVELGNHAFSSSGVEEWEDGVCYVDKWVTGVGSQHVTIRLDTVGIGYGAFWESAIASINIPNSVMSINSMAFYGCALLTKVVIPENVMYIGAGIFAACDQLENVLVDVNNKIYYSEGNCIIEIATKKLIAGCNNSLIPFDITAIEEMAFSSCEKLTSITIPNGVIRIGDSAFLECRNLVDISFPTSLTSIGDGAFEYCTGLTSITIPDNVMRIGDYAFYGCASLLYIDFGEKSQLTNIGERAFHGCMGLTDVIIPDGVICIGYGAFEYCTGLISIMIPNSVASIDDFAFYGCTSLLNVNWGEQSQLVSIGDLSFSGCIGLITVEIPFYVSDIGGHAFEGCYNIASIQFKNTVGWPVDVTDAERNASWFLAEEIPPIDWSREDGNEQLDPPVEVEAPVEE